MKTCNVCGNVFDEENICPFCGSNSFSEHYFEGISVEYDFSDCKIWTNNFIPPIEPCDE